MYFSVPSFESLYLMFALKSKLNSKHVFLSASLKSSFCFSLFSSKRDQMPDVTRQNAKLLPK